MKTFVFGAIGAIALLTTPAFAASGYVGAAYQRTEVDTGLGDAEDDGFGVEAAVALSASEGIGFDLDAAYTDGDNSDSAVGATAHLYLKGDAHKVGAFVGLADVDETIWSAGLEGQLELSQVTLAAAAGYANADDSDADIYGVDGEARFFINDNFRLEANAGWANVDAGAADDDLFSFGVGGEYQFAAAPVSVFAGYRRTEFDTADVTGDAFTLGVRYNWGGSLKDRDRDGPSFAGLSSLTSAAGL